LTIDQEFTGQHQNKGAASARLLRSNGTQLALPQSSSGYSCRTEAVGSTPFSVFHNLVDFDPAQGFVRHFFITL